MQSLDITAVRTGLMIAFFGTSTANVVVGVIGVIGLERASRTAAAT